MAIASYPRTFQFRFGAKETRHKGDGYYNHRFFDTKILFILTGRCRQMTSPAGAEDKTTTQQKSVYIDYRKGARSKSTRSAQKRNTKKGRKKKNEKNKQKPHETNSNPHACLCHGVYRYGHRKLGRGYGLGIGLERNGS